MESFPDTIRFKYPWRSYQQKVLEELEKHLDDRHLHIIAPPGSGKTVLGLEVAIRLDHPTLILAPTLTIRNQWIQRLCELFLDTSSVPSWISTNIRKPAFLTVSTYQGLHTACSEANIPAIINGLKKQRTGTIVIDEAHHLKKEWWNTLIKVKDSLNPFIIGLTATPPYDVNYTEWKRYLDLNGPIDAEISVPELIKEGDLCPHQDHIYFSLPTREELERLNLYRKNVHEMYTGLCRYPLFIEFLLSQPAWTTPKENLEWIYENIFLYTSILIYLHSNQIKIPDSHFHVLGIKKMDEIPPLTYDRVQAIANYLLFENKEFQSLYKEESEKLINRLQRHSAIEKHKVCFNSNMRVNTPLVSSYSKLNSIREIVHLEYANLGDKLRMVILSDYIRSEFLALGEEETTDFKKIGIIPIFETLRKEDAGNKKMGVLTGSITIIPAGAYPNFIDCCQQRGVHEDKLITKKYRGEYLIIQSNSESKNHLVQIVTQLFEEGHIEVLIGTKSLLGEGWDAPAINSLVLASFVGSFVLSNQMRGRAIRTQKNNPGKTSNIWHLVCIDPTQPDGGNDLEVMQRRFRSFVGISNDEEPFIENGLQRLHIIREAYSQEAIDEINQATIAIASNRESIKGKWHKAIENGSRLVEELKVPFPEKEKISYPKLKKLYLQKTIGYLIVELILTVSMYFEYVLNILSRNMRIMRTHKDLYYFVIAIFMAFFLAFSKKTYTTLKLYIQYRDISKDLRQIGEALLHSLIKLGSIKSPACNLNVKAYTDEYGAAHCHLEGATILESSIFIETLQEIVEPIDNPRYIVARKSMFRKFIRQTDYHAVPEILGKNKTMANYFCKQWKSYVGKCELIYTRTIDGRKKLLEARIKALSTRLSDTQVSEQMNRWI